MGLPSAGVTSSAKFVPRMRTAAATSAKTAEMASSNARRSAPANPSVKRAMVPANAVRTRASSLCPGHFSVNRLAAASPLERFAARALNAARTIALPTAAESRSADSPRIAGPPVNCATRRSENVVPAYHKANYFVSRDLLASRAAKAHAAHLPGQLA